MFLMYGTTGPIQVVSSNIYMCVISPSLSFVVMMPLQRLRGDLRGDEVVENGVLSGSLSPAQVVDKGGDERGDERGDECFPGKQPENM